MKRGLLLFGVVLLCFTSCKKSNDEKEGVIAINETKLSMASAIFMKNNANEVANGNPFEAELNYEFKLGDYNKDGEVDLYAIKKINTETNAAEIHILSGATNFKSSLLKTQTVLKHGKANYEFELGDYNNDGKTDLYAIKKDNEESNFVEIQVLNGARNFRSSLLKTRTVLNKNDSNYKFKLGDYNNDGKVDLYTFTKENEETNFVEIRVLNGASNYTSSLLKMETVLHDGYEFNLDDFDHDGKIDLYALKKNSSRSALSEISVLSGASNYRKSLLDTEAILNDVTSNYSYTFHDNENFKQPDMRVMKKQNRGTRLTKI